MRPPTLKELHSRIRDCLDGPLAKFFDVLTQRMRPVSMPAPGLAESAGYSPTSSTTDTYLSRLSTLGLIDRRNGMVSPTTIVFPEHLMR